MKLFAGLAVVGLLVLAGYLAMQERPTRSGRASDVSTSGAAVRPQQAADVAAPAVTTPTDGATKQPNSASDALDTEISGEDADAFEQERTGQLEAHVGRDGGLLVNGLVITAGEFARRSRAVERCLLSADPLARWADVACALAHSNARTWVRCDDVLVPNQQPPALPTYALRLGVDRLRRNYVTFETLDSRFGARDLVARTFRELELPAVDPRWLLGHGRSWNNEGPPLVDVDAFRDVPWHIVAAAAARLYRARFHVSLAAYPIVPHGPHSATFHHGRYMGQVDLGLAELELPPAQSAIRDIGDDPDDRMILNLPRNGEIHFRGAARSLAELDTILRQARRAYALKQKAKGLQGTEERHGRVVSRLFALLQVDVATPWRTVAHTLALMQAQGLYKFQFAIAACDRPPPAAFAPACDCADARKLVVTAALQKDSDTTVEVLLVGDGRITLAARAATAEQLREQLAQGAHRTTVRVIAPPHTPFGHVLRVFDQAVAAGKESFAFGGVPLPPRERWSRER